MARGRALKMRRASALFHDLLGRLFIYLFFFWDAWMQAKQRKDEKKIIEVVYLFVAMNRGGVVYK